MFQKHVDTFKCNKTDLYKADTFFIHLMPSYKTLMSVQNISDATSNLE
jgi:hypothetical protein